MPKAQAQTLLRFFIVASIVTVSYFILRWTLPLIFPFIIAWVIALIINPTVNFLEKRAKVPRFLAVVLTLALFVLVVLLLFTLLVTQIVIEVTQLIQVLPYYFNLAQIYVTDFLTQEVMVNFFDQLNALIAGLDPAFQEQITNAINNGLDYLTNAASNLFMFLLNGLLNLLRSLPSTGILLLIAVAAALFVSKDWYRIREGFYNMMPERVAHSGHLVWTYIRKAAFGFVRAQAILISITGLIVVIYLLILNVDYAITLGLIMALCDLLPYLGVGTILIPWFSISFIIGNYGMGFALAALYLTIAITRQLLEPKIVGDRVGMDPLLTLIALYVGLQIFGVAGALIGPIVVVLLVAVHKANVFRDVWAYITHPLHQQK